MPSDARVTQEVIEAIGPDTAHARLTQEIVEPIGPVASTIRVTQAYCEVLASVASLARETQITVEPIGPPGSGSPSSARVTQLVMEALGRPAATDYCALGADSLNFKGNVTGLFYRMDVLGAETVPINYLDTTVTIDNGITTPLTQTITEDGGWVEWFPNSGPLTVAFSNGKPVRTLWVVTSEATASPPSVPVWASSISFSLWKQSCP